MMLKRTSLLLTLVLALACGGEEQPAPQPLDETVPIETGAPMPEGPSLEGGAALQPLAVGNEWSFRTTQFNVNGAVSSQDTIALRLVADTVIDGVRWFTTGPDGRLANTAQGLFRVSTTAARGESRLLLRFPASTGDRYSNGDAGEYVVASVADSVEVPAGKYVTYRYQVSPAGADTADYFYAPGVGLVKSEYRIFDPGTGKSRLAYRVELLGAKVR
jgi:hypothetical protein